MEKKLQKIYLTYYSLLIVQDLWEAHYQIWLIIYLKDFIELNVNNFEWTKDNSQLNEDFIKNYNEESDEGHFLKVDVKYKTKYGEGLKILTPKQMLQRLPIALAQVKAVNTSENLLNEIRKIIYSSYRAKEITKKVYNNIMNSIML